MRTLCRSTSAAEPSVVRRRRHHASLALRVGGATPAAYGRPQIIDETLEPFDVDGVQAGDIIGIGIHTGNALRGYEIGKRASARGRPRVWRHSRHIVPGRGAPARGRARCRSRHGDVIWPLGLDTLSPVIAPTDDGRQRLVYLHSVGDVNVWRVTTSEPGAPASAQPVAAIASTRGDFFPAVSPDGRRMAFLSNRSGDWQVWVADADGSGAVKLTSMAFRSMPGCPSAGRPMARRSRSWAIPRDGLTCSSCRQAAADRAS